MEGGPLAWAPAHLETDPGLYLLAIAALWGVSQQVQDPTLLLTLIPKQMNQSIKCILGIVETRSNTILRASTLLQLFRENKQGKATMWKYKLGLL